MTQQQADRYDVVVVGCGVAGLSAAVSAAEAGARVAVLERAPREERGGQSRYTEAYLRMKSFYPPFGLTLRYLRTGYASVSKPCLQSEGPSIPQGERK